MNVEKEDYLALLKKRAKETRAFRSFQVVGTDVADMLNDRKHIALYIKIAKKIDAQTLLQVATTVVQTNGVKNQGAYFMSIAKERGWLRSPKNPSHFHQRDSQTKN